MTRLWESEGDADGGGSDGDCDDSSVVGREKNAVTERIDKITVNQNVWYDAGVIGWALCTCAMRSCLGMEHDRGAVWEAP